MNTRLSSSLKVALFSAALVAATGTAYAGCTCHGTLVAKKYYDANANGHRDTGEPWLSGWKMTASSVSKSLLSTKSTNANGTASWSVVPGNDYALEEGTPLESNWVQSAPTAGGHPVNPVTGLQVIGGKSKTIKFGNYCTTGSGGLTPGFWSNKNGYNTMNDGNEVASELALLSSLHLRDGDGHDFDPNNYADFRTWLLGGKATNMAYMLSVHLAAMQLNVESGKVDDSRVYVPAGMTIGEITALADQSLASHPVTLSGDPERALQERLKNWLDKLNNNAQAVSLTPCRYSF
ncbi:MAG: hypothetical protein ACTHKZ_10615 [Lysobacteraceae bacterium]